MRMPTIHTADAIKLMDDTTKTSCGYFLARPLPYQKWRLRFEYAWLVFTGKADAVTWIEQ